MITMPNGVLRYSSMSDYDADMIVAPVAIVYGNFYWTIFTSDIERAKCVNEQDAIDIASFFAQKASHKDCDNCGNEPSLNPNGMQADEPCLSCLREGNKSGWTPIKAKDCVRSGTVHCDHHCRKECEG